MKLQLSERDRVIVGIALKSVPWGGGEARMASLHELGEVIGLEALEAKYAETAIDKIPGTPAPLAMRAELAELLIEVLCGSGQALKAEFGRLAAAVVARVRKQKPRKEATQS